MLKTQFPSLGGYMFKNTVSKRRRLYVKKTVPRVGGFMLKTPKI